MKSNFSKQEQYPQKKNCQTCISFKVESKFQKLLPHKHINLLDSPEVLKRVILESPSSPSGTIPLQFFFFFKNCIIVRKGRTDAGRKWKIINKIATWLKGRCILYAVLMNASPVSWRFYRIHSHSLFWLAI